MPNFGVWEWLVILVIVLVIFGASRLKDIGSGLGGAINAFRKEVKQGREEGEEEAKKEEAAPVQAKEAPKPEESES
ncbi:MAG TPA: twin-arginine translocase TatA/TatE family subunit [Anaerolineae bacterium]|nr:twin-arginine translocase TatA/TatE family subunit [Anaerolineae bacterium]